MASFRCALIVFALLLAIPVLALPRTTPAEQEKNRLKLQELRREKKAYLAVLQQQARAFLALPPARAEQLRQLDQDLQELPPDYRKHLKQVMQDYVAWLDRLSPEEREDIERAPDADAQLELIHQLREQQWVAALPRADRERLAQLGDKERPKEIARLKRQQLKWKVEWHLAAQQWDLLTPPTKFKKAMMPERLADLPSDLRRHADVYLRALVPPARWQELEAASTNGEWPWFPYLLVRLSDDYPLALPGAQNWPLKLADLPDEVVTRLKRADAKYADKLKNVEGRWPQFAAQVAQIIDRKDLRQDLWPTRHAHLSQPMRTFLDKELREAATASEWDQLQNAEGHWPAYPQTIQELAKKYYLSVPWQSLPPSFSPDFYEKYRIRKGALNENPGAGLLD